MLKNVSLNELSIGKELNVIGKELNIIMAERNLNRLL